MSWIGRRVRVWIKAAGVRRGREFMCNWLVLAVVLLCTECLIWCHPPRLWQTLGVFPLDEARYVNVDLTTAEGIDRAARLGLASSGLADLVISPRFHDISRIFSASNQGRMFALFRHPGEYEKKVTMG